MAEWDGAGECDAVYAHGLSARHIVGTVVYKHRLIGLYAKTLQCASIDGCIGLEQMFFARKYAIFYEIEYLKALHSVVDLCRPITQPQHSIAVLLE